MSRVIVAIFDGVAFYALIRLLAMVVFGIKSKTQKRWEQNEKNKVNRDHYPWF